MIWSRIRQRLGPWIGAALIIAIAAGMFWMAVKIGSSPGTAGGDAMSKAARQRMLTP
jgi:hypothetical protein